MTVNKVLFQLSDKEYLRVDEYIIDSNEYLVPVMTSSTSPSGRVRASYEPSSSSFSAFNIFRRFVSSSHGWTNNGTTGWVEYIFPSPTIVNKYDLYPISGATNATYAPRSWILQGSNDGVNYINLHAQSNVSWGNGEKKSFIFNNNTPYTHIRLNITGSNDSSRLFVGRWDMFHRKQVRDLVSSDLLTEDFVLDSKSYENEIDLSTKITKKTLIKQTSVILGEGKVFSGKIDTSKTSIKKVSIE